MTSAKERAVEAGARAASPHAFNDEFWMARGAPDHHQRHARENARNHAVAILRAAFPILAEDADDALRRVSEWAAAYPADVFPEVDLEKVKAALEAAGVNYSALHGTWARHIMNGVAGIVDPARARIQQMAEAL